MIFALKMFVCARNVFRQCKQAIWRWNHYSTSINLFDKKKTNDVNWVRWLCYIIMSLKSDSVKNRPILLILLHNAIETVRTLLYLKFCVDISLFLEFSHSFNMQINATKCNSINLLIKPLTWCTLKSIFIRSTIVYGKKWFLFPNSVYFQTETLFVLYFVDNFAISSKPVWSAQFVEIFSLLNWKMFV